MECDGLFWVVGDCYLEFIEKGCVLVIVVMCKYCFVEWFFVDVIGLLWEEVYVEVCWWEYVMSEDVE